MLELTKEQKESIGKLVEDFKTFLGTEEAKEWQKDREERSALFKSLLAEDRIENLAEKDFGILISKLWASQIWGNKEYLVNKILKDNGLPKIKAELRELLYGSQPLDERYDRFKMNIKGLGPSSITEILLFVFPTEYCLWNEKPINVLPFLKMKTLLRDRVYKYPIKGHEYVKCNQVLQLVRDELSIRGIPKSDFVDVDFFMAYIFYNVMPKEKEVEKEIEKEAVTVKGKLDKISGHPDAEGVLLELGNLLGFDTFVCKRDRVKTFMGNTLGEIATLKEIPRFTYERLLETVREIDVIWFKEGYPQHCFEVEHSTDVKGGLLREFQIRKGTNAKFFIIAPKEIYSKFKSETNKDPFYQIRDRYIFKSYKELVSLYNSAIIHYQLKGKFGID